MKLMIGEYEVEIKAKNTWTNSSRMNKRDTISLLNIMSLAFSDSSEYHEVQFGRRFESMDKKGDDIYNTLNEMGVYDKYHK